MIRSVIKNLVGNVLENVSVILSVIVKGIGVESVSRIGIKKGVVLIYFKGLVFC